MKISAKYIIIKENGLFTPLIFSCNARHSDMSNGKIVYSAGFVDIICDKEMAIKTYGESVSLNISSKSSDSYIIQTAFDLSC